MKTRSIGSLAVTVVGLGTNNFGLGMSEQATLAVVDEAIERGVNVFDTSDSYGESEERLGRALRHRRDKVLIATKFGSPVKGQDGTGGGAPAYVQNAVEASLKRLATDRIDLYQMHKPDPQTPIADTLGALAQLVEAGKVREIGCSNFSAAQIREASAAAADGPRFVCVQNHYNLLNRGDEGEVIPTCQDLNIAYIPYFPLASGLLTGKYKRDEKPMDGTRMNRWEWAAQGLTHEAFDKVDALTKWASDHGHSVLDLAIAWLAAKPMVASVITGATKAEQVAANVAASGWELSPSEVAEVDFLCETSSDATKLGS